MPWTSWRARSASWDLIHSNCSGLQWTAMDCSGLQRIRLTGDPASEPSAWQTTGTQPSEPTQQTQRTERNDGRQRAWHLTDLTHRKVESIRVFRIPIKSEGFALICHSDSVEIQGNARSSWEPGGYPALFAFILMSSLLLISCDFTEHWGLNNAVLAVPLCLARIW